MILLSMEFSTTMRVTWMGLYWPSRWMRSMAWSSTAAHKNTCRGGLIFPSSVPRAITRMPPHGVPWSTRTSLVKPIRSSARHDAFQSPATACFPASVSFHAHELNEHTRATQHTWVPPRVAEEDTTRLSQVECAPTSLVSMVTSENSEHCTRQIACVVGRIARRNAQ